MKKDDSIIFCLDTSAFVDINRYLLKLIPRLFTELDKLFNSGRIISHVIVYEEITAHSSKRVDSLTRWIRPKKVFFKDISLRQTLFVADIVQKFPTLISYKNEKNDADPWVIATALEQKSEPDLFSQLHEFVVVSTESKFIPNHIPAVCKYYSIRHFDLPAFFSAIGWTLQLQTSPL
jgi:hypothetical protein